MENKTMISNQWVKVTFFQFLSSTIYWESEYAAESLDLSKRQLYNRLVKGPVSSENYFVEGVRESKLPGFVTAEMSVAASAERMRTAGLMGASARFEQTTNANPYQAAGFKRIHATAAGNYAYGQHGFQYLSLAYTFCALGIKVNSQFVTFVAEFQKKESDDIIWPIAEVHQGIIPAFDILYDVRYRDDLFKIAQEFKQ